MSTLFGKYRTLTLLLGGLVLFVGAFQLAELVIGPDEPRPAGPESESTEAAAEPISIEIRRPNENSMIIEVGGHRHTTLRIDSEREGNIDAIVACIEAGIEQARKEGLLDQNRASGLFARQAERNRVGQEVSRIQRVCFQENIAGFKDLPPLEPPPTPTAQTGSDPEGDL